MNRSKHAFTLIELLVVIAVISLLAAILFPVFGRARENARRSSCQSNLRQLGLAMEQYVNDFDGAFSPISITRPGPVPEGGDWATANDLIFWPQLIWPYHKSTQIYRCPSAPLYPTYVNSPQIRNYGANEKILPDEGDPVVKQVQLLAPATTYMFMDAAIYQINPTFASAPSGKYEWIPGSGDAIGTNCGTFSGIFNGLVGDCQRGRHLGGVNVTFADGHVKWLPTIKIFGEAKKTAGPAGSGVYATGAWDPRNS